MWTKANQMTRAGRGGKRRWRNEQKDEESVEEMQGMCRGHETAGGGEGTVQIKWLVTRRKV